MCLGVAYGNRVCVGGVSYARGVCMGVSRDVIGCVLGGVGVCMYVRGLLTLIVLHSDVTYLPYICILHIIAFSIIIDAVASL